MKRYLVLFIAIICFLFPNISYCADVYEIDNNIYDNDITPLTTYISDARCSISISNGYAYCEGFVKGVSGVTSTKLVLKLQSLSSGTWKTISAWNSTGKNSCSISNKQIVTKGNTYRVYCEATAKTETIIIKSSSRSY